MSRLGELTHSDVLAVIVALDSADRELAELVRHYPELQPVLEVLRRALPVRDRLGFVLRSLGV